MRLGPAVTAQLLHSKRGSLFPSSLEALYNTKTQCCCQLPWPELLLLKDISGRYLCRPVGWPFSSTSRITPWIWWEGPETPRGDPASSLHRAQTLCCFLQAASGSRTPRRGMKTSGPVHRLPPCPLFVAPAFFALLKLHSLFIHPTNVVHTF